MPVSVAFEYSASGHEVLQDRDVASYLPSYQQFHNIDPKNDRKSFHTVNGDILLIAFHAAYVVPMKASSRG